MTQNIDLGSLTSSLGFSIIGDISGDQSGYSASEAGDVNGDGIKDVVIGAPEANSKQGVTYVIFGSLNPTNIDLNSIDLIASNRGFSISSTLYADRRSGESVSGVGDINGDGYDDIIIGAYSPNETAGRAYVIYGKASFSNNIEITSDSYLSSTGYGFYLNGGFNGISVSGLGNINGDVYYDIIVGSPYTGNSYARGTSYIIYGGNIITDIDVTTMSIEQGFSILGDTNGNQQSGYSVNGNFDFNNDGYDDILIGAPYYISNHGISYIIFGKSSLFSNIDLSTIDLVATGQGFSISGAAWGSDLGWAVSGATDINNDGYDDIIVAAPYASPSDKTWAGTTYIVFGKANNFNNIDLETTDLVTTGQGFSVFGANAGDQSGWSVSGIKDVNIDGYNDIIIGAWQVNSGAGASYVIFGKSSPFEKH